LKELILLDNLLIIEELGDLGKSIALRNSDQMPLHLPFDQGI
jgi:hypothetical protein